MSLFKIVLIVYGLLMLIGGYMGWAKAGSKPSLIMGVVSSILIFWGVSLLGSNAKAGRVLVTVVSGLLCVVFVIRLMKTHAFMPAGMLFSLSAAVLALCIGQLLRKT